MHRWQVERVGVCVVVKAAAQRGTAYSLEVLRGEIKPFTSEDV
jgi:hypothetical protein